MARNYATHLRIQQGLDFANMMVCSPISTCTKNVVYLSRLVQRQMSNHIRSMVSQVPSRSCCFYISAGHSKRKYADISVSKRNSFSSFVSFEALQGSCFSSRIFKQSGDCHSFTVRSMIRCKRLQKACLDISWGCQNMGVKLLGPKQVSFPKIKCDERTVSQLQGYASAGLFGLMICYSSSEPGHAEASQSKENNEVDSDGDSSSVCFSHGKRVYTDYSIIGIPGDGRCLFRSVAHGACLRSGKLAPSKALERELADELRAMVADEFVKRRKETEWFIEGDFDTYVSQIRKPHVWGGEPELLMSSHVLRMPITVYMYDADSRGLISIAEYGQEYGKEDPIRLLYHGFGHYDGLQIPGKKGSKSRL